MLHLKLVVPQMVYRHSPSTAGRFINNDYEWVQHVPPPALTRRSALAATALLILSSLLVTNPASADESPALEVVSTKTDVSAACVAAVRASATAEASDPTETCLMTSVLSVSPAEIVSPGELASARASMSDEDYRALQDAVAVGAVRSKNYSQSFNNIVDGVSQSGKFYYDGSRAWVTKTYRGYSGSHSCKTDWAVGYVVELKKCDESGSTSERDLRAIWHFSVIPSGGMVNWDEEKHMFVNSSGKIWQ